MTRSDAEIIEVAKRYSAATPEQRKAMLDVWLIESKKVVL